MRKFAINFIKINLKHSFKTCISENSILTTIYHLVILQVLKIFFIIKIHHIGFFMIFFDKNINL